jgi:hypothetical protein
MAKGKEALAGYFYRRRRERASGRAPRVSVGRLRRARPASHRHATGSPIPGSLTCGPWSGFEEWHLPEMAPGRSIHSPTH